MHRPVAQPAPQRPVQPPNPEGYEQMQRLADAALRSLEARTGRIAERLTDDVAPLLTMARYAIESAWQRLAQSPDPEAAVALQSAAGQLRGATERVMAIAEELRPAALVDLGLLAALSWYVREFARRNEGMQVSTRMTLAESEVPARLRSGVFRVVQASLENVERHSLAGSVRIGLASADGVLRLVIADDGVGFDLERWRRGALGRGGSGLLLVQRWVESGHGRITLESSPRRGCRITACWPLTPPPADPAGDPPPVGSLEPVCR
jgi:two-component system NarL family sensor kinase